MKKILLLLGLFATTTLSAQEKRPEDFGFRYFQFTYLGDPVEILVKSKAGEENVPKPLFLFCQGSLPIPLIQYGTSGMSSILPFAPDRLTEKYHLIVIGKPFIPTICSFRETSDKGLWLDAEGRFPQAYSDRNLLSYYVPRNLEAIRFLQEQPWASSERLVVAGHSEGSTVAADMAAKSKQITHLIYAGGNPAGRIVTMIRQGRDGEEYGDSLSYGEEELEYWKSVVSDPDNMDDSQGDTNRAAIEFSMPPIHTLRTLTIPVLVAYGTKDWGSPYIDYFRVEAIWNRKANFTFFPYIGADHGFYPLKADGTPDRAVNNWNQVANDWMEWLSEN